MGEYNANSIKNPSQRDHVRMRTGIYLGDEIRNTAAREVFDNSVDEVVAGYGNHVRIKFYDDGSIEVTDSGRGVPVDSNDEGISGIELALGKLNSGGKFDQDSYESGTQAGLNGVGSSATNMISSRFSVKVYRNKKEYSFDFKEGIPGHFKGKSYDVHADFVEAHDVIVSKDNRSAEDKKMFPTGTSVRFTFDDTINTDDVFERDVFLERITYYAYLIPALILHIVDESGNETVIDGDGGLPALLSTTLPPEKLVGEDVIHIKGKTAIYRRSGGNEVAVPIDYEVVIGWEEKSYDNQRLSFANAVKTNKGTHTSSFDSALETAMTWKINSLKILKAREEPPSIADILEGSRSIIRIEMVEPPFSGQDKHVLGGRDIYNALRSAYEDSLKKWMGMKANADAITAIANKIVRASRVREMQTLAKKSARKKVSGEDTTLNMTSKLIACSDRDGAELYICEGNSALSTVKAARDSKTQAALPIRGKILNAYKTSLSTAMKNAEIADIVNVIGAGVGNNFDVDAMNYDRIVITTDADFDGNHISSLLFGVFYTLMRPVVLEGRLFVALPPLFVITETKTSKRLYAMDKTERDKIASELDKKKIKYLVTRCKGLGEMDPDEFSETVLSPKSRAIKKVTVEDVKKAEEALELIFSKDTNARKEWLKDERPNYDIDDFDL